jgi:hypothetical protein
MKKLLPIFIFLAALTSCADSYVIEGSSTVPQLDGSKLYLKVLKGNELTSIDSCEVVHGKFRFSGSMDTTQMASLYMDDQNIMPLVVEKGNINILIEGSKQKVSGTLLNDRLYEFLEKHDRLANQLEELDHRFGQMLLDGIDETEINKTLSAESDIIIQQEDSLVTDFVTSNFDNVLGPFVFVRMTSSIPQIEHILSKAPDTFKRLSAVDEFYKFVTGPGEAQNIEQPAATSGCEIDDATMQNILNGNENAN